LFGRGKEMEEKKKEGGRGALCLTEYFMEINERKYS
jgi:hypothetical protein